MNMRLPIRVNWLGWLLVITGALITANATVTGNKIFFAPLLLLGLWGWIRFATRYPAAALIIVIFFAENCFDIFSLGLNKRFLSDIGIALMLPLIVLHFRRGWNHITQDRSPYAVAILIFFCAIVISLYFGSHLTFGQPMAIGLTVARKHLLFLSYFFMVAVGANREECYRFMKYLAWLGAVIAFLSIIEAFLGGGVIFSNYYAVGQERAGMLRIHVGTFLVVFSVIYSFIQWQHSPNTSQQRFGYLLLLGMGLTTLVFVVMTRAVYLGLMVIFALWMVRKITNRKIMFLCTAVSLLAILFISGLGDFILSETFIGEIAKETSAELGADKGNISIRQKGAQYYMDLMLDNAPLTGVGIFSFTNFPNNPVTQAAEHYHYYIVDTNGITTLVYFGLQGALLLAFFSIKSLKDTFDGVRYSEGINKYHLEILFFVFIYTLATPTLNNIIVERMLIYSGVFFYLLSISFTKNQSLLVKRQLNE
ncbi:MAG: O-antigen ligase family protein [Pseudomonadota bacterium]